MVEGNFWAKLQKFLIGSIGRKLFFAFFAAIFLVTLLTYSYITLSEQALIDAIGKDEKFFANVIIEGIEKSGSDKVNQWSLFLQRSNIAGEIAKSNAEFDSMDNPLEYSLSVDKSWIYSPFGEDPKIVSDVINNSVSNELRKEILISEEIYGLPLFSEVFLTNKYGAVIAETSKTTDYYQADEAWWQNARNEGIYVSDIIYDASSKTHGLELCISVNDKNGSFAGVLKVVMDIRAFTNLIEDLKKNAYSKDGKKLEVEFITSDGKLMYSTAPHRPYEDISRRDYAQKVLSFGPPYFITYYDITHKEDLFMFAYANSFGEINFPNLGWSVITYRPANEVLEPGRELTRKGMIIFLTVILFIFVISLVTSFLIVQPIKQLKKATDSLGEGKLSQKVVVNSGDELQELASAFNKSLDVLIKIDSQQKQIDRAKTQFITITSHELRSPMTPMKANLQMLEAGYFGKLNKKQMDALEVIFRNTDRLDKILLDFLEISRIEAARLQFTFKKADLAKTVEETVRYMTGLMPEKKIKIKVEMDVLPIVECDSDRISQVLRNLISNAIKFSPKTGTIKVSAKDAKYYLLFSVGDEGIGISPDDKRHLFEPFFQVDKSFSREIGGTGLGLAICRGIIESQNGKIWVESEVGKGSTFFFTVPLVPIREIKPIRVLFSNREFAERQIEAQFKEVLGPIGALEFERLKESDGLSSEHFSDYVDGLVSQGIIDKQNATKFKDKVADIWFKGSVYASGWTESMESQSKMEASLKNDDAGTDKNKLNRGKSAP
ncbi:MAG: sensor histidine kinase [archaeon]